SGRSAPRAAGRSGKACPRLAEGARIPEPSRSSDRPESIQGARMNRPRHRPHPAVAGLLLAGLTAAGCADLQQGKAAEAPRPGVRIYVANESSNNITVVDGVSQQVVGTIDSRNQSTHDLSLSRDGKWLFATNLGSGNLSVIDTAKLETIA